MMKLTRNLLIIFLLLLVAVHVFAQDEISTDSPLVVPTQETDVVVPAVPAGSVDTVIVFAFMALFAIIGLGGTALLAYLVKLLGNSVKTEQLEGLLASVQKYAYQQAMAAAGRTEATWDDSLVMAGAGLFGYKPNPNPHARPIPRPTLPDTTAVLPEPDDGNAVIGFTDIFGVMGTKQVWKMNGHPDAVIEIPAGYTHVPIYMDGAGKQYPGKAIETNDKYGTRLNIAHTGSIHKFTRQSRPVVGKGKNVITLDYESVVNADVARDPYYNWLWINCYINGNAAVAAQIEGDTAHHISIENGMQQAVWVYESAVAEPVEVAFEIVIHWGLAGDMSHLDLKRASLKKA